VFTLFLPMALSPAPQLHGKFTAEICVKSGYPGKQSLKVIPVQPCCHNLSGDSPDISCTRLIGDNGTFAEKLSRPKLGNSENLVGTITQLDTHSAGDNEIEKIGRLFSGQDDTIGQKYTFSEVGVDAGELFLG
jgi:hypothetical protein